MNDPDKSKTPSKKRRLFLVEDHPVTRDGIAQLINYQPDLLVCGQAATAAQAIHDIPKARPDLAIIDISLAQGDGIELIKDLAAQHPALPTMILSMHDERIYAARALRSGARGYIMKQEPTATILACIRAVLSGQIWLSENMHTQMLGHMYGKKRQTPVGVESLSDRELEVFRLIGQGQGTREISRQLNVSISTIETYRAHIKEKLALLSGTDLVAQAIRWVENQDR